MGDDEDSEHTPEHSSGSCEIEARTESRKRLAAAYAAHTGVNRAQAYADVRFAEGRNQLPDFTTDAGFEVALEILASARSGGT